MDTHSIHIVNKNSTCMKKVTQKKSESRTKKSIQEKDESFFCK